MQSINERAIYILWVNWSHNQLLPRAYFLHNFNPEKCLQLHSTCIQRDNFPKNEMKFWSKLHVRVLENFESMCQWLVFCSDRIRQADWRFPKSFCCGLESFSSYLPAGKGTLWSGAHKDGTLQTGLYISNHVQLNLFNMNTRGAWPLASILWRLLRR